MKNICDVGELCVWLRTHKQTLQYSLQLLLWENVCGNVKHKVYAILTPY